MEASTRKAIAQFVLIFCVVMVAGLGLGIILHWPSGNVSSAVGCPNCPVPTTTVAPRVIPAAGVQQFAAVDKLLQQAMSASFAYNAPENMQLDQTVTLELLIDPAASPAKLATQVAVAAGAGSVVSGSLAITPRMKAELIAQDDSALQIKSLQDSPEQLVSATSPTHWSWWVTAKKEGPQHVSLLIYRLVQYNGQSYWREVKSYESDIVISVSLVQRIQDLDWNWFGGVFVTALLVPGFWRWLDGRRKPRHSAHRRS